MPSPSMKSLIQSWKRAVPRAGDAHAAFRPGVSELTAVEARLGRPLPPALGALYGVCDGFTVERGSERARLLPTGELPTPTPVEGWFDEIEYFLPVFEWNGTWGYRLSSQQSEDPALSFRDVEGQLSEEPVMRLAEVLEAARIELLAARSRS